MGDTVTTTTTAAETAVENNYPYSSATGLDPTVGVTDGVVDVTTRIRRPNFETIAQNLAAFPSRELYPEANLKVKTFYITATSTITLTTDWRVKGTVVKTLAGDTGLTTGLTKTVVRVKGKVKDTVYS